MVHGTLPFPRDAGIPEPGEVRASSEIGATGLGFRV